MIAWKWMPGFHIRQSKWGREQDSGETERVCVRDGASLKAKDSISHKTGQLEETFGDGHMQVISESFRCC